MINRAIKCDVISCKHNEHGCNCGLNSIHVGCGFGDEETCCDNYDCR